MCGIAGFTTSGETRTELPALRRVLGRLAHRGPDDEGILTFPDPPRRGPLVALGNRRLSIIDLSPAGHQPMTSGDGRYSLTFNGEIYNYRELRRELEAEGHRFRSLSDTEVLLHALVAWGPNALPRLEGMFAFALLDRLERRLLLARDPFGIKPLFYHQSVERLVFASEIPALLEFGGIGRGVNLDRIHDYLVGSNTDQGATTLFAEIRQVPPAHLLEVPIDALGREAVAVRYWDPDDGTRVRIGRAEAAEALRALFLETIGRHLRSDVPVGFALSGGLDSSSVLLAARAVQGPDAELHAFSYVADDPEISEARYQDIAVSAAGAMPHRLRFTAAELARDFDRLTEIQAGPFASPTIYAQYRIFALAREAGLRVMLGGQGSDEIFAGYNRYLPARIASLVRQGAWGEALRFFRAAAGFPGVGTRGLAVGTLAYAMPAVLHGTLRKLRRRSTRRDWIDTDWLQSRGFALPPPWRPRGHEVMKELLVHTIEQVHLQALMRYEDRNAMAFSIENRVPFLSPRIARFAFSLPESFLLSPQGEHKAILRQAMRGIVPDPILDRRDKVGFAVPAATWLAELEPWVDERLAAAESCPVVKPERLRAYWSVVRQSRDIRAAFVLWRAIGLVSWAERFSVTW